MHPSVLAAFASFTEKLEGHCDCMYLDVKGLVTTGRGNLIDPMYAAQGLPWTLNGVPATHLQVATEWWNVKGRTDLQHASYPDRRAITTLRLSDEGIDELTDAKLRANDAVLAVRFPAWEALPADAQLAVHSLAWACGASFAFPRFVEAISAQDFATAADEVTMSGEATNPGIVPRNAVNRALLLSAARGLQPFDQLHYLDGAA